MSDEKDRRIEAQSREIAQWRAANEHQKEVIETRNGDVETEQMWVRHWYDKCQEQAELIELLVENLLRCTNKINFMLEHGEWYAPERTIEKADEALTAYQKWKG